MARHRFLSLTVPACRFPHNLAGQVLWREVQPGVYECRRGTDVVRVVVLRQLPLGEHNAPLHLFSAAPDLVKYGAIHYQQHSPNTSTLVNRLFADYQREGLTMPYTMEDFRRDSARELLEEMSPEERLKGLSLEERLKGLSPEEQLKGLSPEEILKHLPRAEIEAYLKRRGNGPSALPG